MKFKINSNFFEVPNIINSYWAGFIAADGNVCKNTLAIKLHNKDHNHLVKFSRDIEFEGKIAVRQEVTRFGNIKTSAMQTGDSKIVKDLFTNFNIVPRKSLILKPPKNLSIKNMMAYIMGLIDGDGCIGWNDIKSEKRLDLTLCGSLWVMKWVKRFISKNFPFKGTNLLKVKNIYYYRIHGLQALEVLETLIKETGLWETVLNRKWDVLRDVRKYYNYHLKYKKEITKEKQSIKNYKFIKELSRKDNHEQVYCLLNHLSPSYGSKEDFLKSLKQRKKCKINTVICVKDDKIVGTASYKLELKLSHGGEGVFHIEDVVVLPDYRGQGIAGDLIKYCILVARGRCYKLNLTCKSELRDFYEKFGFREVGIEMRLDLGA